MRFYKNDGNEASTRNVPKYCLFSKKLHLMMKWVSMKRGVDNHVPSE